MINRLIFVRTSAVLKKLKLNTLNSISCKSSSKLVGRIWILNLNHSNDGIVVGNVLHCETEHKSFKVCCCFDVFFLVSALGNNLHFTDSVSIFPSRHSYARQFFELSTQSKKQKKETEEYEEERKRRRTKASSLLKRHAVWWNKVSTFKI